MDHPVEESENMYLTCAVPSMLPLLPHSPALFPRCGTDVTGILALYPGRVSQGTWDAHETEQ